MNVLKVIMVTLLTGVIDAKALVCQMPLTSLNTIQADLISSVSGHTCYELETSDKCVQVYDSVNDRTLALSKTHLAVTQGKSHHWQFQNRAQLGFYAPWVSAVEAALRGKRVRDKNCSYRSDIYRCRIALDAFQSMTFYQTSSKNVWISDYAQHQEHQIVRWNIIGDPVRPQLTCPQNSGENK